MKIYPNDSCPCGSGKKYKLCCSDKKPSLTGNIAGIPVCNPKISSDFYVDPRGAVVFLDETKQPVLDIPEGSLFKNVLSVGVNKSLRPIATIQEPEGPVCYILPAWYTDWCMTCVGLARMGKNLFPTTVEFSKTENRYAADFVLD